MNQASPNEGVPSTPKGTRGSMERLIQEAGLTRKHIALIFSGLAMAVMYIGGVATYLALSNSTRPKDKQNLLVPSDASGHLETRFALEPKPPALPIPVQPKPAAEPTIVE